MNCLQNTYFILTKTSKILKTYGNKTYAGENVAVSNVFTGCVNWFKLLGNLLILNTQKLQNIFFLLSINPAKEKYAKYKMTYASNPGQPKGTSKGEKRKSKLW